MSRLRAPLDALLDAPHGDWQPLLAAWRAGAAGRHCVAAIDARVRAGTPVHPQRVFRAFELTPRAAARVVILGQDPYHGPRQAEGLAFSVPDGVAPPPSLRNIFRELQRDLGQAPPHSGSLARWAERGVLLLNTVLTVEEGRAASHAGLGWEALSDAVVAALAAEPQPKVFMLWGAQAQRRAAAIDAAWSAAGHPGGRALPHLLLRCNHPSPLAAMRPPLPFIGCGHFGLAARFLARAGRGELDWTL